MVMVSVEVPPGAIDVGVKAFAMVGGATMVKVALAVPPFPPLV